MRRDFYKPRSRSEYIIMNHVMCHYANKKGLDMNNCFFNYGNITLNVISIGRLNTSTSLCQQLINDSIFRRSFGSL